MALQYKTQSFIFKKEDRQEADRIFTVFAREFGRIEIFAKSIRKIASKLKGGIEIFSLSEISFIQGKNKKTLTDAIFIKKFNGITEVPEKITIASNIGNLLDSFIKGQEPDEKIWTLITDFFEKLNSGQLRDNNQQLFYYYFFWNFISALGYAPELFTCARCHKELHFDALYFSNKEGGVIGKSCRAFDAGAQKINSDVVKILRLILKNDWQTTGKLKITSTSLKLLQDISGDYHNYLLHSYSLRNNVIA